MVDDGADKLAGTGPTEQGIQVDVGYPPNDEGVRLMAVLGSAEVGDVKKTGDVVGPEI